MNKKILAQLTLICCLLLTSSSFAQLTVSQKSAIDLVKILVGTNPNVEVITGSEKITGYPEQFGEFSNGTSTSNKFTFDKGIIMSSGNIDDNTPCSGSWDCTSNMSVDYNGNPTGCPNKSSRTEITSPTLEAMIKSIDPTSTAVTRNAAILEFDFKTKSNKVEFNYVFASTEYPKYVCSEFFDLFGFFITGPDPNSATPYSEKNIALIPGTSKIVSINSLNSGVKGNALDQYYNSMTFNSTCRKIDQNWTNNKTFYVNNLPATGNQYGNIKIISNGLTTKLTAKADILCDVVYRIKIVIADVNDGALDSYVYLEEGSFKTSGVSSEIRDGAGNLITGSNVSVTEGCKKTTLDLIVSPTPTSAFPITYSFKSTSTANVTGSTSSGTFTTPDFKLSTSEASNPTPKSQLIIPANTNKGSIIIEALKDGITDANENIIISIPGQCGTASNDITITLRDEVGITATGTKPTCTGATVNTDGTVNVTGKGGKSPYTYSFAGAAPGSTTSINNLAQTTSYNVKVIDADGCEKDTNVNLSKTCPSTTCTNPVISTQPKNAKKCEGLDTNMTVVATGISSTSLSYQWQIDKGTGTFVDTVGATNATLNLLSIKKSWNNYKYKCIVTESTNGPCNTPSDPAILTVDSKPTATSSGSATICKNGTAQVSGVVTTNVSGYSWSENGDGSISSGATTLTPTYTPDIKDTTKTITLTMVSTSANSCPNPANVTYSVTVDPLPIAKAGGSTSICVSGTATVSGAFSTNSTIKWTENGAGSITSLDNILTPTYTPNAGDAGNAVTLTMTSTSTNSCPNPADVIYTVNVTSTSSPTAVAGGPSKVCAKKAITLAGASSTNGTNLWTKTTGNGTLTGETTLTPTYTSVLADTIADVELKLTVSPGSGCTGSPASSIHKITVNKLPKVIPSATKGCLGTDATLDGNTISGASYSWSGPNAYSQLVKTATIPNITPADTGLYELKIKDINGCIDSTKVRVSLYPIPTIVGDTFVCVLSSVTLSASNSIATSWISQTPANLTIDPATGVATAVKGGVTKVEYTDANGCKDEQLIVTEDLPEVDFVADSTSICIGNDVKFIDKSPIKHTNIVWDFGDGNQTNDIDPSYTYQKVDSFTVSLTSTSPNGCEGKLTKNKYITPIDVPTMKFGFTPDSIDIYNPEIQFNNYSTAKFFTWNFGDFSPVSHEKNPLHTFPETPGQAYKVTLKGSNSLSGVCPISVYHEIVSLDPAIYFIPNSFTPNGDEINNTFQPIFTSGYDPQNYSFWIYNRLGQLVFESHNAAIGWDGTYGGKLAENNTYVWKLQFKSKQTEKEFYLTGHVNLVK